MKVMCHCEHAEKDHCKGNVAHSGYKDQARMVPKPKLTICTTRHCTQPLCDCINLSPKSEPLHDDASPVGVAAGKVKKP